MNMRAFEHGIKAEELAGPIKKQHGHILLVVAKPEWIKPYRGV
jgi:hypothetical protein